MLNVFWVLLGAAFLYFGGETLVRYSTKLARRLGISSLVVGLTVVAFGTSSPELAATLAASMKGSAQVALGNVIGSNIVNIGLILGICALITPLGTGIRFIRQEVPFLILTGLLFFLLIEDGLISRLEGVCLLILLILYLWAIIWRTKYSAGEGDYAEKFDEPQGSVFTAGIGVLAGIALLSLGARSLIEGAVNIAQVLGIPDRVIGLTLVAFSTGLPELASCGVASLKKETDFILGNIIGSNIFNVLCILGAASLTFPISVQLIEVRMDLLIMIAFSVLILPFLGTNLRLGRREGAFLTISYIVYIIHLYM